METWHIEAGQLDWVIKLHICCQGLGLPNWRFGEGGNSLVDELALSQRLSPLGLIFRSPTPTSGKIILINFRISLFKYIKLIKYYSRHYVLSNIALFISFDYELLEL